MSRPRMRNLPDLVRLYRAIPGSAHIFLRREYDRYYRLLRRLAKAYRHVALPGTRVVAVVGSLGKTTARRALDAALCCPDRNFSYSNYGASLAANILRVRPGDAHAVLEAGVDGPGPMAKYAGMLRPDIVVVTSIKSEHNRSFPSLFETRAEKVKMVSALSGQGLAVLNGDDPHVRWMATQTRAHVVTVGTGPDNDVRAANLCDGPGGMAFTAVLPGGPVDVQTRFAGRHMVYPFLAALAVAVHEGVAPETAAGRLAGLAPAEARMEMLRLPEGVTILDDSYKGAVESTYAALDALAALPAARRLVVFGGVDEPPGRQGDVNRDIGRRLGEVADRVLCLGTGLTGVRAGAVSAGLKREMVDLAGPDYRTAVSWLKRELRPGDTVLIKGQSALCLRRVAMCLQGRRMSCAVSHCKVKVPSCYACPLADAPPELFRNRYIARYVRE